MQEENKYKDMNKSGCRIKGITVTVILAAVALLCSCVLSSDFSNEEKRQNEKEGNFQTDLNEKCKMLDDYLESSDVNGIRAILVNDLKDNVDEDTIRELTDLFRREELDINPYEVDNITGMKRGTIDGKTVIYSDMEFYQVKGVTGTEYHIWIQMCNYIEGDKETEGINFIKVSNTTNGNWTDLIIIGYYYANNTYNCFSE